MNTPISRISRILFLIAFFLLFVTTDYRGKDEISIALNSFFRANPLVALSYLLSEKTLTVLLIPGLVVLVSSFLLGRFFCGWICPLGTILDLVSSRIKKTNPLPFLKGNIKYYLLFTLLFAALFGANLTGLFDPIAILVRFLTFSLYPIFGLFARAGWSGLYNLFGDYTDYLRPGYTFLKSYVLPFRDTIYPLAFLSVLAFLGIIFLERFERRNWCKNLCPLGTVLGLAGRFSIFRRLPSRLCDDCGNCKDYCHTAFEGETLQKQDCIMCLECLKKCPSRRVTFRAAWKPQKQTSYSLERRVLVGGLVSGLFASRLFSASSTLGETHLLRPPGVDNEGDFLKKCVRCGECMKVCLRKALYPASLEAGLYGLYTPMLVPRLGYCEYNCTLCGQVCPTGAIPRLPVGQKQKAVIGQAVFDRNLCLPYAKKLNCMVCEEHCPVPDKAIRFEEVRQTDYNGKTITLKQPYVINEICTGCGICEYVCPLEEKAGIDVLRKWKRKL